MPTYLLTALIVLHTAVLAAGQSDPDRSDEARIRQTTREHLTRQYSVTDAQIKIRVDQLRAQLPPRQPIRVQLSNRWEVPRGRTRATILTQHADDGWKKSGWALLYVAHYDSVVVSSRPLRPDEEITPDDVDPAWVDVTRLREQPLTPDHYRTLRAKDHCFSRQYIREGEIIRQSATRRPYAARSGDLVMMIYERSGIAAHLRCKARQSGFVGDIVRIACPSTGSLYRAKLTEEGTAEWVETL